MSDILYIQTEKNVEVQSPEVYLQDVASLSCSNGKVLNRNKARKLFTIPNEKPGRYVISALEIVDLIQTRPSILFLVKNNFCIACDIFWRGIFDYDLQYGC